MLNYILLCGMKFNPTHNWGISSPQNNRPEVIIMRKQYRSGIVAGLAIAFLLSIPAFATSGTMGGRGTMTPGSGNPTMTPGTHNPTMTPGTHNPTMTPGTRNTTMTPGTGNPAMTPGTGNSGRRMR